MPNDSPIGRKRRRLPKRTVPIGGQTRRECALAQAFGACGMTRESVPDARLASVLRMGRDAISFLFLRRRLFSSTSRRFGAGGRPDRSSIPEPLPEPLRNELLRRLDWRFLLRQRALPRALDLTSGPISEALPLVCESAPRSPGGADLVVMGFPSRKALRTARTALRSGGEVVCVWRIPRLAGMQRARVRLGKAGFTDAHFHWPGPLPYSQPAFWLPLDAPAAVEHLLSQRPPRSRFQAALRPLWRAAERGGLLAPLYAVARGPDQPEDLGDSRHRVSDRPLEASSWILLTGGQLCFNKVVGLPFVDGQSAPSTVVKFARVGEADRVLDREAEILLKLEDERPGLAGIPRLRADGWRTGRRAIVQSAMHGQPLVTLTPTIFADVAPRVTGCLIDLAGDPTPRPASEWRARLISDPLARFGRRFEGTLGPGATERARLLLSDLGDLPLVWEHRDLGPGNIVLTATGAPAFLDWETAEPRGLPGLDLAYFLAGAAFMIDGIDTSGPLALGLVRESHKRLLDPTSVQGRIAAACVAEYCARLGLDPDTFARLRLLCWIVQSLADYEFKMKVGGQPGPGALRESRWTVLMEQELHRLEGRR